MAMRLTSEGQKKKKTKATLGSVAVLDFVSQTMLDDPDAAIDHVRHLLDNGVEFQDILLELMAPAARILGERWEGRYHQFCGSCAGHCPHAPYFAGV